MAKKIYIKFALLFIAINLICLVNLYAATEEVEVNENNVNNSETTQESEELKLQKEQLNNMIKQLLDEILPKRILNTKLRPGRALPRIPCKR